MAGPLRRPDQFRRGRKKGLPGQSEGDDPGFQTQFKIIDRPSATIFEKELIQMGSIGAGRYLEISVDGVRMYVGNSLMIDIQTDGDIFVGDATTGEYVKIHSGAVELYSGGTKLADIQSDGEVFVGDVTAGDYVKISGGGVETYSNGTLLIDAQVSEDVYVGNTVGGEYVKVTGTGIEMYSGGDKLIDIQNDGDIFVGNVTAGEYVKISSTGIDMYSGGTQLLDLQTDGDIFVGDVTSGDYVKISSAGVETYVGGTKLIDAQSGDDIYVGKVSGGEYVKITSSGIELYSDNKRKIDLESDGDVFIGRDLGNADDTYLSIFANNQTYNGESVSAGDMLIGDNSSSKANIFWDKSQGRLEFRGGETVESYIDTDGSYVAGAGDVKLDSDGLTLLSGTGTPNQVKVKDGSDVIMQIYSHIDANTVQLEIISEGKDSGDPEAIVLMQAKTYDGTGHAGAGQVYISLDTAQDNIVAYAEQLRGFKVCRLTGITTTQRNALTAAAGMIIYNTSTSKFQGRAGTNWVDLH